MYYILTMAGIYGVSLFPDTMTDEARVVLHLLCCKNR